MCKFKKKQRNLSDKPLNNDSIEKNIAIEYKSHRNEYKNTIFYPSSTKEWFSSVYSYNKSYIKSLIVFDVITNNMLTNYFNMLEDKIKLYLSVDVLIKYVIQWIKYL